MSARFRFALSLFLLFVLTRSAGAQSSARVTSSDSGSRNQPRLADVVDDASRMGQFSNSVFVRDDWAFVGEPESRFITPSAVFVFHREDGTWVASDTLFTPEIAIRFGEAITATDNELFVGAPNSEGSGAVYRFVLDESTWMPDGKIQIQTPTSGFGIHLDVSGDLLLIGAPYEDANRGAAYAFRRDPQDSWVFEARLAGTRDDDGLFGYGLALAGPGAVVTAQYSDNHTGVAYAFARNVETGTWMLTGEFTGSGISIGNRFGRSIAGEGDRIAIGAPFAAGNAGLIYTYEYDEDNGTWTEEAILDDSGAPDFGYFGWQVAMDSDRLLGNGLYNGAGVVFDRTLEGWSKAAFLVDPSGRGVYYGYGNSISGNTALVGAQISGFAVFFDRSESTGEWETAATFSAESEIPDRIEGHVSCTDGKAGVFSCHYVDLLSFLPISDLGGSEDTYLSDLWGWTDPVTGTEYALVARTDGVAFVDLSDPEHPNLVGTLPTQAGVSAWRDVKVINDYAVVVGDDVGNHGMQIFDLSQLRSVSSPPVEFQATAVYDAFGSAHNVAVNEETDQVFIVGITGAQSVPSGFACGPGPHIVDMRTPLEPLFAGCYSPGHGRGYTHDVQCLRYDGPDSAYVGRDICIGSDEVGVSITDVTDPAAPVELSRIAYPDVGYAHQGWLTEDERYFIMGDELDEEHGLADRTRTLLFDVEDLDDPVMLGTFEGRTAAIDHNLYTRDGFLFQANYSEGLVILDLHEENGFSSGSIEEIASFDVYPGDDAAHFVGAWNAYPYFESGIVIVSGIESGLFVLQPQLSPATPTEPPAETPDRLSLELFPNPTSGSTRIVLTDHKPSRLSVIVFDLLGREVATVFEGTTRPGTNEFTLETGALSSGVYLVRAKGENTYRSIPLVVNR